MSLRCCYHDAANARWTCVHCKLDFCSYCGGDEASPPYCLCCRRPMEPLPLDDVIPPFPEQLPMIFRLPLEPMSLVAILAVAVLWFLSAVWMPYSLILLLPAMGVLAISASRLTYRVALGWLREPPSALKGQPGLNNVISQAMVLIALFALAGVVARWLGSPGLAVLLGMVGMAFAPAALMTVIVTDSVIRALNPVHLYRLALNIGWPYLMLCLLLMILSGMGDQMLVFLSSRMPVVLAFGLSGVFYAYAGMVMAALLGYVAYQQHRLIGQPVRDAVSDIEGRSQQPQLDPPPDQAQLLMMLGRVQEAQAALEQEIRVNRDNFDANERFHRMAVLGGNAKLATDHGLFYIARLLERGRDARAFEVYERLATRFEPILIDKADYAMRLAQQARERRRGEVGLRLLNRYGHRFPGHPSIPAALLLTAQLLMETGGDDQQAIRVVQAMLKYYPTHELVPVARRYLKTLGDLAQRRAGTMATSAPASVAGK